jgi:EAL domain-containing protein (putative c-di-GMP-specific phosphodiesterase class I)
MAAALDLGPMFARAARGRVLLVDDNASVARSYARVLTSDGYEVDTREDGLAALEAVRDHDYDVVLSDIDMPRLDGLGLLARLRKDEDDVPFVLVTGNPTMESAISAVESGALRYLRKPVDLANLRGTVADAIRVRRAARDPRPGLSGRLEHAIDSLWMAYQPIVSWSRREVVAYEALLRSREPSLPAPGDVLEAAERLGRLDELGRVIRARAAHPAAQMPDGSLLFVNLHARDLLDDHLFAAESALSSIAGRVVLEITERASLHEVTDLDARLARLRGMGFRLAVDDLGAGYSGLTSFAQLEPDIVKLDVALVRDIHAQPTKMTLVRTIVAMCLELGIQVVAEGIETRQERDAVVDAGCDLLQGYLFSRPGSAFPLAQM